MSDYIELDPVQESLMFFREHIENLPIEEAESAVRGIQAYLEDILNEREIVQGHAKYID